MRFETSKVKGWLIGDPHIGRDFRNGTPLHRRGEREAMQLAQFKEELATPDVNMVVMVGDLFDKPFVPLPAINDAAYAVIEAARDRPDVRFIFQAGNHDVSRQTQVRGAWELFTVAVSWLPNVWVITQPYQLDDVAFFPWEWVGTAAMQVEYFQPTGPVEAVVGHWDCVDFGHDEHMVPVKQLREKLGADIVFYTGHDHGEGEVEVNGATVIKTGSMQPYTHGEDEAGEMYVTLTPEEALARDDLKNKCVRILLPPGEDMPDIDCLQLTMKRPDAANDDEELVEIEVGIGAFDLNQVIEDEFNENEVPDAVRGFIKERLGAVA